LTPTASNATRQFVDPTDNRVTQESDYPRCATAFRTIVNTLDYTECGYFYNWCAALGNAYASCSNNIYGTDITNAGVGLCPSGWRLPRIGEFQSLYTAMDSDYTNWLPTGVWRGVLAGYFFPSVGLRSQSIYGYYWASTVYSEMATHIGYFDSSSAGSSFSYKYAGFAVRCIAI
jgi:hypothetical protein